ncbi:MAG: mechanosensitive ion channel, partial [Kiritimatiellia bacterium]
MMDIQLRKVRTDMWEWLTDSTIAGVKIWQLLDFFVIVLLSLILGRLLRFVLEKYTGGREAGGKKTLNVILAALAKSLTLLGFALGVWLGMMVMDVGEGTAGDVIETVSRVLGAVAIGYTFYRLIDVVDYHLAEISSRTESKVDDMLTPLVGKSLRITVVVVFGLQVIQSFSDKPVTSVLAGLGVGGLAVALAGQDTIKNFFGSVVILGDKPTGGVGQQGTDHRVGDALVRRIERVGEVAGRADEVVAQADERVGEGAARGQVIGGVGAARVAPDEAALHDGGARFALPCARVHAPAHGAGMVAGDGAEEDPRHAQHVDDPTAEHGGSVD